MSRAHSLDRRLFGVFPGIVEDNDDPDKEGRVTLRFPWLDDATVSDWVRVTQPYAGKDFGAVFVPEKKMEVLVAFVHGRMDEPIVIGGLYNGVDKPPTNHDGTTKDVKMIKTKAGHVLRLDDSSKARAIEAKTAGGHHLTLDDQGHKVTLEAKGGGHVVIDDNAKQIEIKSGASTVTIDSTGKITVKGSTITLQAGTINLTGKVNLG